MVIPTNSINEQKFYEFQKAASAAAYKARRAYDAGLIKKSLYNDYLKLSQLVSEQFDDYMTERGHDMS